MGSVRCGGLVIGSRVTPLFRRKGPVDHVSGACRLRRNLRFGISKPLHREGGAAEFLVHDGICYIHVNHLYGIMVCGLYFKLSCSTSIKGNNGFE